MKYLSGESFSVALGGKAYSDGWDAIFATPAPASYAPSSPDQLSTQAAATGRVVTYPGDDELFVDLDSGLDVYRAQIEILRQRYPQLTEDIQPSVTAGHYHVRVRLGAAVSMHERLLLQACLGSDLKRELLAYNQGHSGVFFE